MSNIDQDLKMVLISIFTLLIISSLIGRLLTAIKPSSTVDNLNTRIDSWWIMWIVFVVAVMLGDIGTVVLFFMTSFLTLREFITLTAIRRGDHEARFWYLFIFLPLQYLLVGFQRYESFSIVIPVYLFLFLPARIAIAGDAKGFREHAAKIQWGMLVAVFCVSHIPALLILNIPNYEGQNIKLLLFLIIVVQMSDVLQYVFGKLFDKRPIVPKLSPNKTVGGFIGGIASAVLLGTALYWITPSNPWQAALISLLITLLGFAGMLTMSAIKHNRGIKDFGAFIQGHGGMLDRIDSLCFATPIFFHVIRYFYL